MLKKLTSRKFILTLISVIGGVATALVSLGGTSGVIAGLVVAVIPTIVYVITEGRIDEKAVSMITEDVQQIVEGYLQLKEIKDKDKDKALPEVEGEGHIGI